MLLVFLCSISMAAAADQANVFIYHRFNDDRYPSTNISVEDFNAQLQVLADEQYNVLSLGQVVDALSKGEALPERCAVITVDDAYKTFKSSAWPLLKKFGYPATLFVNTDQTGGSDFLSWEELIQLQEEGVELGNHSASHPYLLDRYVDETSQQWRDRVVDDITRAQEAFLKHTGTAPELFAYPYGEFSNELARVVEELGFRAAVGQQSGVMTSGQNLYKLPRFPVGGGDLSDFRQKLKMRYLHVLPQGNQDTVITDNKPPEFIFSINSDDVAIETLRCYASSGLTCDLEVRDDDSTYIVTSTGQMNGRRGKYTLTASDSSGENWYWYSQLWVLARGSVPNNPVTGGE